LVIAFQAAILVVFVMAYIATLSLAALFLNLLFTAVGAGIHLRRTKEVQGRLREARTQENRLHEGLTDMLDGFKEVKINRARGDELLQWIESTSEAVTGAKSEAQRLHAEDFVLSQVTFFVLTATMVFLVPLFGGTYSEVVIKTTAATLFLIGPISNLVTAIPLLARTQAAVTSISSLEQRLVAAQRAVPQVRREFRDISEIRFEGVRFRYDGSDEGFEVGPLDVAFRRGETVFISGGNGSGKTTLIRLLTGLYRPQSGRITVDGVPVGDAGIDSYRELFATVFSDYHLFKRLYGIHDVAQDEVEKLFRVLELEDKTRLVDREFQSVDLSSGQRKRLALMVSVLEHKPITVFDEWAADQDPHFRRKFYTEILSWMKQQGATIIAVTHDDRYYEHADRTLVMREGRIVEG
jgi:putative ATP-binding cassette transporter